MHEAPADAEGVDTTDVAEDCRTVMVADWVLTLSVRVLGIPGPVPTLAATSAGDSEMAFSWEDLR